MANESEQQAVKRKEHFYYVTAWTPQNLGGSVQMLPTILLTEVDSKFDFLEAAKQRGFMIMFMEEISMDQYDKLTSQKIQLS